MEAVSLWTRRKIGDRFHYAWVAVGVTFVIMLLAAATRATPGVMIQPLEFAFGWDRSEISAALSINLALFGLVGPFAAAAMERFGLRVTVLAALLVLTGAIALSSLMRESWHMALLWGVMVGTASGITSMTLGATVVNRWFKERRGLAMGVLTASNATGQLIFLPVLASVIETYGWRPVVWIVAGSIAVIIPLVYCFMPEAPSAVGLPLYGEPADAPLQAPPSAANPVATAFRVLAKASTKFDFWLLFFSFFVCGASSNGYIGSHFIAMCGDNGLTEVQGASILAAMGALDLVGTTMSGWLSDRFNNRVLLFCYYGFRGLALLYLPSAFGISIFGLPVFALIYGLDWIATVPPTVRLATDAFGAKDAPIVFGWILAGHQVGAAFATLAAGIIRHNLGSYTMATFAAGGLCMAAALVVLGINRRGTAGVTAEAEA